MTVCSALAVAVAVAIGAGCSGGAVTVGGGDGAGRRSVDGLGCKQAWAKWKQQGSATVGSGSVVRSRLRVAQSGLGRARRWLVQAVAVATAAVMVTQGFAMGGRK